MNPINKINFLLLLSGVVAATTGFQLYGIDPKGPTLVWKQRSSYIARFLEQRRCAIPGPSCLKKKGGSSDQKKKQSRVVRFLCPAHREPSQPNKTQKMRQAEAETRRALRTMDPSTGGLAVFGRKLTKQNKAYMKQRGHEGMDAFRRRAEANPSPDEYMKFATTAAARGDYQTLMHLGETFTPTTPTTSQKRHQAFAQKTRQIPQWDQFATFKGTPFPSQSHSIHRPMPDKPNLQIKLLMLRPLGKLDQLDFDDLNEKKRVLIKQYLAAMKHNSYSLAARKLLNRQFSQQSTAIDKAIRAKQPLEVRRPTKFYPYRY